MLDREVALLYGRVDADVGAVTQQRFEERKTLDVVPVEVAQQARRGERLVERALLAEVAQARAEVEEDRVVARDVDGDARRVPAVANDLLTMAGRRTTDAVERDAHPVGRGVW